MISATLPKKFVAIDTEDTGLYPWNGHRMFATSAVFPSGRILFWRNNFSGLRRLLKDCSLDKVFHHAKYDLRMLEAAGFKIRGKIWDTMIFGRLLDGNQLINLESMANRYLPKHRSKVVKEIDEWFKAHKIKKADRGNHYIDLPPELLQKRCEGDSIITCLLFAKLYPIVAETFPRLLEQEHRLISIVKPMETIGLLIDNKQLKKQKNELNKVVETVTEFCEGIIGNDDFSITKPNDCNYVMRKVGLGAVLDADYYMHSRVNLKQQALRNTHHPVAYMIILGRRANSLIANFIGQIENYQVDNILHPGWNPQRATTGRFSSSKPSLGNLPSEGGHLSEIEAKDILEMTGIELLPHIKRIFKCRPGYCFLASDKSRIEVCMAAHYAKDKVMIDALNRGLDIHKEMTIRMFNEYNDRLRVRAKVTVFGYLYGAGDQMLADNCLCSLEEARSYRARLNQVCPSLSRWRRLLASQIYERGYLITEHGRRHYLSRNDSYMAVNRMCQGTAADEVKSNMVLIGEAFAQDYPDCHILMNISDALVAEVPLELLPKVAPMYHELMEQTSLPYRVPLPSSLEVSKTNLAALKKYKTTKRKKRK